MPFSIMRADLTQLPFPVDAIVNTARLRPTHGTGTDAAIYRAAGPGLAEARRALGHLSVGAAAETGKYQLPNVRKIIIHTVAPVWRGGGYGEVRLLRTCYENALNRAAVHACRSIVFPLLASGNLGFPRTLALQTAISAFTNFLLAYEGDMAIYLAVFDEESFAMAKKLQGDIAEYIDEPSVSQRRSDEYTDDTGIWKAPETTYQEIKESRAAYTQRQDAIDDILFRSRDILHFSPTLQAIVNATGLRDVDICQQTGLNKSMFSKIKNKEHYAVKKQTALAIAAALQLNPAQTGELLRRAGFLFPDPAEPADAVVWDHMHQPLYTLSQIDDALSRHGFSCLKRYEE